MSDSGGFTSRMIMPTTTVPSTWANDRRISLAAFGLLVRLNDYMTHNPGGAELADVVRPDELLAAELAAGELRTAGYICDGNLTDPHGAAWHWDQLARNARPEPGPAVWSVYYARRRDGAIKIGVSQSVDARVRKLAESYGALDLLAVERDVELSREDGRHAQFESLRLPPERGKPGGTEWFRPGPDLLDHIAAIAVEVAA